MQDLFQNTLNLIYANCSHAPIKQALTEAMNLVEDKIDLLTKLDAALTLKFDGRSNWRNDVIKSLIYANGGASIGIGATLHYFTDSEAYTVIAISKSGKEITLQADTAVMDASFKPEFHVGGFSAHCSNQSEQRYSYTPNPQGGTIVARLRKDGKFYSKGLKVTIGRRAKFHDFNF